MRPSSKSLGRNLVVLVAVALPVLMLLWPLANAYAFVHDEYHYCTLSVSGRSFAENVRFIWQERQYRLLDLLAGYLCNPATLDAKWTMLLQAPPLVAIVWGIHAAAKRFGRESSTLGAIALVWFHLHSATAVALWIPTVGQTWSAAAGLWLALNVWSAIDCINLGTNMRRRTWASILLIGLVAPHIKETYYGWVGALALAISLVWFNSRRIRPSLASRKQWLTLGAAVLIPPIIQVLLRTISGGLGLAAHGDLGRHHATIGSNVIYNAMLSIAGDLAASPIHYARRIDGMKFIAYAGVVLSGLMALAGMTMQRRRDSGVAISRKLTCLVASISWLAVAITWPMERISELYLMGPNIGMSLAIATGVLLLWNQEALSRRVVGRCVVLGGFLIAGLGWVSRAIHFGATWRGGRNLYAQAYGYQSTLRPSVDVHVIGVPIELTVGWQHSQYVMPASNALCPPLAEELLNTLRPDRRVRIVVLDSPDTKCDFVLESSSLDPAMNW